LIAQIIPDFAGNSSDETVISLRSIIAVAFLSQDLP